MVRFSVVAISFMLVISACAHGGRASSRTFRMPLATAEAPLVIPAIGAAAEKLGYESSPYGDTGMSVSLGDGSRLVWSAMNSFTLTISTPKQPKDAPTDDVDARFRALKVKADEVWDLAIELRQKNNVGAAMVVNPVQPPPPAAQPQRGGFNGGFNGGNGAATGGWNAPPQQQPSSSGQGCRSSLDCGSGGWCRDWRGQKVCMNKGGAGSPCNSALDCASGLFCRGDTCG